MRLSATTSLRIHHALRAASGGAFIAVLSLATSVTPGCLTAVIYFICVIAGTPDNLQGFQLRCASLTFLGAILGISAYAIVHLIASTSSIATFFVALPFIVFFSALRADAKLTPLPPVANVLLGFLTISRFPTSISALADVLPNALIDVTLGWLVANLVNLFFADRASDEGRRIVATELRNLGAHISTIATKTFSQLAEQPHNSQSFSQSNHLSLLIDSQPSSRSNILHQPHHFFETTYARPTHHHTAVDRTEHMTAAAYASLNFFRQLPPLGRTRVQNFSNLAAAARLFEASAFEPCLVKPTISRWRNATAWKQLVNDLQALVAKVASLESVACGTHGRRRFSPTQIASLFGEAFYPLWIAHYAACSAACAAMSNAMCHATCKEMFHLDDSNTDGYLLHDDIDARKWNTRRAEMYAGFLSKYRLRIRTFSSNYLPSHLTVADFRAAHQNSMNHKSYALNKARSSHKCSQEIGQTWSTKAVGEPGSSDESEDEDKMFTKQFGASSSLSMAKLQALSFFGITSHAMSEEIAHVQQSMVTLASTTDARGLFAPFRFIISSVPILFGRVKKLCKQDIEPWELRFMFTHSFLLLVILALALFLPVREKFEAAEIAWVFTSAALAAQLSAEPTLFIGAIRVVASITGGLQAFGFSSILDAIGRKEHFELNYLIVPYVFVAILVSLLILPPKYRYAAFLNIVTNFVLLFCPRATAECNHVLTQQTTECYPDWQYAISRVVNVSIGVVFAVAFHLLFWPRYANQVALRTLSCAFINAVRLMGKLRRTYFSFGLEHTSSHRMTNRRRSTTQIDFGRRLMAAGDVYRREENVMKEIQHRLSDMVSLAALTVKLEAGVWEKGPLRLSPLLPHLLNDFIALDISLKEMASLLGRCPIFSESYGPSVYRHFIQPLLPMYETIHISLNNMVGLTERGLLRTNADETYLRELAFDLHQGIEHLARIRSKLRSRAAHRLQCFERSMNQTLRLTTGRSQLAVQGGRRFSWSDTVDSINRHTASPPHRASTDGNGIELKKMPKELCIDDLVLYNAFSFIADSCLSAFVRIAAAILTDSESKMEALRARKRRKND
ncbi:hypothetical protein FGB62_66g022 [Gracilaria domingensis]|nr:hypothetical protein FGB62_66g022 [Gracilaria domingensis]